MAHNLDELQEIQVQRQDLITKLEKIEARKATVSTKVYEKVKREYEDKLKKLDERLAENADLMKAELERLNQEQEKIEQEEKEVRLDGEEIELRYTIGEYDEKSYKKAETEHNKKLNAIAAKLQEIHERMSWIQNILTPKEVEAAVEPEKPVEEAVKTTEQVVEEKLIPEEMEAVDDSILEEIKPDTGLTIDEHILEEKLTPEEMKLDELVVEEEAVKPETVEEGGEAKPEVTEEKETAEEPSKKTQEGITCPKCGHVNTPDSWYCQKCGAEIFGFPA